MPTHSFEKDLKMREELLSLLSQFNCGDMPVQIFQDRLEELNKRGIFQHLAPKGREVFNGFFTWYAGMFDPSRPPRPGLVGRFRDTIDKFQGEYRVSLEQLQEKAKETEFALRRMKGDE
jgi:hypothetical protein